MRGAFVDLGGFEPPAGCLQGTCATNCAIGPGGRPEPPRWPELGLNQRPHPYQGCALTKLSYPTLRASCRIRTCEPEGPDLQSGAVVHFAKLACAFPRPRGGSGKARPASSRPRPFRARRAPFAGGGRPWGDRLINVSMEFSSIPASCAASAPGKTRTSYPLIKSQVLCLLSFGGVFGCSAGATGFEPAVCGFGDRRVSVHATPLRPAPENKKSPGALASSRVTSSESCA